ncbi:recombinase family protein [Sphingomonas sp. 8AM]|uniref:recombinase family protein n=1 Tax=Sphingomonas sp. 8AM TaxID=2653170 RepID=UPI001357EA1A|nr:recombinase family protein [Sphingomonas sp. 8AM]
MQTVIYARYSSQLQNARSIEDQIAVCRERAEREGWTIVEIFTDYAISGAAGIEDGQRPGLNALLNRVEAGGINQVLTESTDRMARHQGDAFTIRERLQYAGCRLFTLMDGVIDEINGTFKALMDARFRADLGARIKRGQRGTVAQGRAPAGLAYGYRRANKIDERGELVRGLRELDPVQAPIVLRIFERYAAGDSPRAIAKALTDEGVPPPRGATWRQTTISGDKQRQNGMLNNRLYAGTLVHNRTSKVINPRTRRTTIRPNPENEWVEAPAPELRIVSDDLWQAVQLRRQQYEGKSLHVTRRPKHLLSGLGVCGVCGGGWIRRDTNYWCCGRFRDGGGCTNNRTIKDSTYQDRVLDWLRTELLSPDLVATYVREYHRHHTKMLVERTRERSTLERRRSEAQRKLDRLVGIVADGGGEFAEIREALGKARADRDEADRQLARIEAPAVIGLHPMIADDYRRQIEELAATLAADNANKEAAPKVRALIDRIILTPKGGKARGVDVNLVGRLEELIRMATGSGSTHLTFFNKSASNA